MGYLWIKIGGLFEGEASGPMAMLLLAFLAAGALSIIAALWLW